MGGDRIQVDPTLLRYVAISSSQHRASLGMLTLHLLGYHFVSTLDGGLGKWLAAGGSGNR
jgi:hypothetical protein